MTDILQLAIIIVGYTEIFKNILPTTKKFFKFFQSLAIGVIFGTLYILFGDNEKLWTVLTAFAVATVCYDAVLKRLMHYVSGGNNDGEDSHTISAISQSGPIDSSNINEGQAQEDNTGSTR